MEEKEKATAKTTANENDTAKIQKLSELATSALRLPIDGLNTRVQEIITTEAKALNCPTEFIMGAAVTAIAQAAGCRFYWYNEQYTNYLQFYTAIVGDSTANKTSAISKMFKPLEKADREAYEQWQRATAGMKPEVKARTAYKVNILNDYTLEAYQDALKFNPDGVTAYNDELLSFFGNMNRYRPNGADEKFFLTTYGNSSDFKKTRRGQGLELITQPKVRIIGAIQPKVLGYFRGNNMSMLDDGLLPRFTWYDVPEDFIFDDQGTATNTAAADNLWNNIINAVLRQRSRVSVLFDSKAAQLYQEFKNGHARAKNAKTLSGYEAAVCGKLEIHAIMWAMAVRVIRYALEKNPPLPTIFINEMEMAYSLRCMEYFRQTAMRVYDIITNTEAKLTDKAEWVRQGYKMGYIGNSGRGWQVRLAELLGVERQKISDYLSGRR